MHVSLKLLDNIVLPILFNCFLVFSVFSLVILCFFIKINASRALLIFFETLIFFSKSLHLQIELIALYILSLYFKLMKLFDTKVIAVSNQKGGVGKTTSSVNIAAFLAVTETPTLLVDMDPQSNATSGIGIEIGSYERSVYDIIIGKAKTSEVIQNTELKFLDIIPSSAQLVGAEIEPLVAPPV